MRTEVWDSLNCTLNTGIQKTKSGESNMSVKVKPNGHVMAMMSKKELINSISCKKVGQKVANHLVKRDIDIAKNRT